MRRLLLYLSWLITRAMKSKTCKALLCLLFLFVLVGCADTRNKGRVDQVTNIGNLDPVVVRVNNQSAMTQDRLQAYMDAQNIQLQRDFLPAWGINAVVVPGPGETGVRTVTILPTLESKLENPGSAWGFHNNRREAYVGYDAANSSAFTTPEAVMSHEVLELLSNEYTDPNGFEVGDPFNMTYYLINGVSMHNFALPSFYKPGSAGPWDYMGLGLGPLTPLPGRSIFARVH